MNLDDQIAERRRKAKLENEGKTPLETSSTEALHDEAALIIPVDLIDVGPQARTTFEGLESLAKSIKEKGQIQAVVVKPLSSGRYELIIGERRLRAIRDILGEKTIRATLKKDSMTEADIRVLQLVENKQRADYEPLELAKELTDLKEKYNMADTELAEILGVHPSWIYKMRSLNDAPETVKERIRNKSLSVGTYWNNKKSILAKKSREVLVKVPYAKALQLTRLLQKISEQNEEIESITLPKKPKKEDLLNIIIERTLKKGKTISQDYSRLKKRW